MNSDKQTIPGKRCYPYDNRYKQNVNTEKAAVYSIFSSFPPARLPELQLVSFPEFQKTGYCIFKKTYYRFLNESKYNRKLMASADADKRLVPASESIDKRKAGYKSRQAATLHKPQAAVKMIPAACSGLLIVSSEKICDTETKQYVKCKTTN